MLVLSFNSVTQQARKHWKFQSIDTMKTSRDLAREHLKDPNFSDVVDRQVSDIAKTGATHIAIATPYDDEFLPIIITRGPAGSV